MAPPRQGTLLQVRVPDEDVAAIDKRAASQDMTRSELVRKMLRWALAQPMTAGQTWKRS